MRGLFAIAALVAMPATGWAQTDQTVTAATIDQNSILVNARLGAATVDQIGDPVIAYGAGFEAGVGSNATAGLNIDYWNESSGSLSDTFVSVDDLSVGAFGKLYFSSPTERVTFNPYGKAGIAVHRFELERGELANEPFADVTSSERDINYETGLDLGAGAIYAVQENLSVQAELLYRTMFDAKEDLDQLALTGGLLYSLR